MNLSMPMKRLNFVMERFLVNYSNQSYSMIKNIDVRRWVKVKKLSFLYYALGIVTPGVLSSFF